MILLFYNLTETYKPNVFTITSIYHVTQIIAGVWYCNYLMLDIDYRSGNISTVTIVSVFGVLCLYFPLIMIQSNLPSLTSFEFEDISKRLSIDKVLYFYVVSTLVTSAVTGIAFIYPGITQVLISISKIKWLAFVLLGIMVLVQKKYYLFFYLAIAFEFLSGFLSFFSEFKTVLFYVAAVYLTFIRSINVRQLLIGAFLVGVLIYVGLMWTSIKGEYRSFLNKGEKSQTVRVSKEEAFDKVVTLSNTVEDDQLEGSTKDLLDRLQYTFHFAKAVDRVPSFIPFQNGQNLWQNIEFVTTPRFLNPDKPVIDNSLKTTKYTGIIYASGKSGVSFSLGYFAEFYIDFGFEGVFIGLLVLGFLYAMIFKYFITKSTPNLLINYAIAISFFMEFYTFEADATFLFGRIYASLVTYIVLIFFFRRFLFRFLSSQNNS